MHLHIIFQELSPAKSVKSDTNGVVDEAEDVLVLENGHSGQNGVPLKSEAAINGFFAGEEAEEASLYDESLLGQLDFTNTKAKFNPPISATEPGPGLAVRPLRTGDYDRGKIPQKNPSNKF